MKISPLALAAKKVVDAAWLHGDAYDLSSQAVFALESAQLLQSPETAAELKKLRAEVAALREERRSTNEALDDAVQEPRAPRILDRPEFGRLCALFPARTDRERIDATLASIGILTPAPPSEPGTCPNWYWDGSGWWQCVECPGHDSAEGHGNGSGLTWADGVEYAEPSCPCPPASRPHQVGCPLDGVPGSERPVNELTAAYMPVPSLREVLDGEHYAAVHRTYQTPHDLPETGGAR